jgi:two-component system chemotaxis response regulator CheY
LKKVLVVDDSQTVRLEVGQSLRGAGFTVLEARDGLEGLQVAGKNPDLSLIILDVNMPVLGGLEMLEQMKRDPVMAAIPVLLFTTEAQESAMARAKAAGAKGWLVKPVKAEMLIKAATKVAR